MAVFLPTFCKLNDLMNSLLLLLHYCPVKESFLENATGSKNYKIGLFIFSENTNDMRNFRVQFVCF